MRSGQGRHVKCLASVGVVVGTVWPQRQELGAVAYGCASPGKSSVEPALLPRMQEQSLVLLGQRSRPLAFAAPAVVLGRPRRRQTRSGLWPPYSGHGKNATPTVRSSAMSVGHGQCRRGRRFKFSVILVGTLRRAGPNPSLKRSANGRPPGPRGAVGYSAPHGPGVLPLSPAYLER